MMLQEGTSGRFFFKSSQFKYMKTAIIRWRFLGLAWQSITDPPIKESTQPLSRLIWILFLHFPCPLSGIPF